jgi:hypothetical protein
VQFGAIFTNAVVRAETGAAAMTFDLILIGLAIAFDPIPLTTFMIIAGSLIVGFWLIGKSIYLMVS